MQRLCKTRSRGPLLKRRSSPGCVRTPIRVRMPRRRMSCSTARCRTSIRSGGPTSPKSTPDGPRSRAANWLTSSMTTTRRRSPASHARIASPSDADYLAVMSRAVFQAGLSWAAIDRQWEQLVAAFGGFAPPTVGAYGDRDVGRIMAHPGILHSERKILATIHNAQALLAVAQVHGSVRRYLRSLGGFDD